MSAQGGIDTNYGELQKAYEEIADKWMGKVVDGLFGYVGPLIVQEMQSIAPVGETGNLKAGIHEVKTTPHTVTIVSDVDYSVPVDQGHRTRGSTFVEAQPFFSSVIGRYTGGELIRQARVKMNKHISTTFSHYRSRI